jgi:hypothetical protein
MRCPLRTTPVLDGAFMDLLTGRAGLHHADSNGCGRQEWTGVREVLASHLDRTA